MAEISWEELNALACARQFAPIDAPAPTVEDVVSLLTRIGPIQAQTARSPFLGLAARMPGLTRDALAAAYESGRILRGSTLRGTVHTCTPVQHAVLDPVTRLGQRALWRRTLRLKNATLEEVWAGIEKYAGDEWRSPAELAEHLRTWLVEHDEDPAVLDAQIGRYFTFGHGGLVRRPLSGGWERQGAPGYRAADAVVDRGVPPIDPAESAMRLHLAAHGPASRHDLAWWSGLGLRQVDAALAALDAERPLVRRTGPDGREYVDLQGTPDPVEEHGVRLLPEFDAVLCGYDPKARDRFIAPDLHHRIWIKNNGQMLAPLLVDGRVAGHWRLTGTGKRRVLEVSCFERRARKPALDAPVAALELALGLSVGHVEVSRADPR